MSNKTLVIVDFQFDFYQKDTGTLYVKGAEDCVLPICDHILDGGFDRVVLTLDWHTPADASFQKNGGIWPVHCVQYSVGAGIHPAIMNALQESGISYEIFLKGNSSEHEEYGAFEKLSGNMLQNYEKNSQVVFSIDSNAEHEICGLAGDYCVFQSYKNMIKHGLTVKPFYDGIAWIGEPFDYETALKA